MKRLLPLITAFILTMYMVVPGEFGSNSNDAGAAVTELQDDAVYTSPKQDDQIDLPNEVKITLLATVSSSPQSERTHSSVSRPSVPNIRAPPTVPVV